MSKQAARKDYKPGDIVWRSDSQSKFSGIVESGELCIEHRYRGMGFRTVKLGAGEHIQTDKLRSARSGAAIYIRAVTDASVYILKAEKTNVLPNRTHQSLQHIWWPALVMILIASLTWRDMTHLFSGLLFLVSSRTSDNSQRSMQLLEYAESLDKNAVFVYNRQGFLEYQQGNLRDAKAAFINAVAIEEGNAPALNNLAASYFAQGETWKAMEIQQNAIHSNPDHPMVQYNLGLLLMEQHINDKAIYAFKEASYIEPNWALPYLQMSSIYLQMQDYVRAEQAAKNSVQRDRTQESAHLLLAIALYNQGRYQEALAATEQAMRLNPNNNTTRFYQAIILGKLGNLDSALAHLQEMLDSSSNPQVVSRIKAEIEALRRSLQDGSP